MEQTTIMTHTTSHELVEGDGYLMATAVRPDLEYLMYASMHISAAIEKSADAPGSAAQHERQAKLALHLGRVPTVDESLDWTRDTVLLPISQELCHADSGVSFI